MSPMEVVAHQKRKKSQRKGREMKKVEIESRIARENSRPKRKIPKKQPVNQITIECIKDYHSGSAISLLGSQFTMLDSVCSTIPKEASYAEIELGGIEHEKDQLKQEAVYMLCKLKQEESIVDGKKKIEQGVTQEYFDSTCVMQFVTGGISCDHATSISDMIGSIPRTTMIGWDSGQKRLFFIIELTESIRKIYKHKTLYRKLMKRYEKLLGVEIIDYSDPTRKWHYSYAG